MADAYLGIHLVNVTSGTHSVLELCPLTGPPLSPQSRRAALLWATSGGPRYMGCRCLLNSSPALVTGGKADTMPLCIAQQFDED